MWARAKRLQRKHNEPNNFKAFRRACFYVICAERIHSIKLCSVVGSSVEANGWRQWWWHQATLLPVRSKSASFFFSLALRCFLCSVRSDGIVALVMFAYRLSISVGLSAHKIAFISIHLFFYWIFYFRSIRFRCYFFLLFFRCWTVFLFISLSLHPERPCCTCAPIISLFMAHINTTQQHWYACTALHYSRNMDSSNIHVPKWVLNRCIIFECWLFCGSSMKIKFLWKILFVEIRVKSNKMRQEMNGKIIRVKQRQLAVIRFRRKNNNEWKQNKSVVQTFRCPFLQLIIFGIHFYSRRSLSRMPDSVNFVLIFPRAYNFFLIQCK